MAHIIFGMYATPEKHRRFMKWVNQEIKYEYEGKTRKGFHQPNLSEIKLYDVRIKKEFVDQFKRDCNIKDPAMFRKVKGRKWYSGHWRYMIRWPIVLFRKLFRLKGGHINYELSQAHEIGAWHYAFLIGDIDDLIDNGEEIL